MYARRSSKKNNKSKDNFQRKTENAIPTSKIKESDNLSQKSGFAQIFLENLTSVKAIYIFAKKASLG